MADAKRKIVDCRKVKGESNCTLAISGTEEEILDLAVLHAVKKHGYPDSPELRSQIKEMMEDAK